MTLPAAGQMHPTIRAMVEHWRAIHPQDGLPGRQHFDPMAIARLLPNVWLLDVARDPYRFRYRVIGSGLMRAGPPMRAGHWLHETAADPAAIEHMKAFMIEVVETRTPKWRRGTPVIAHSHHIGELEVVALPLARDGVTVDTLLNATVFYLRRTDAAPSGPEGLAS